VKAGVYLFRRDVQAQDGHPSCPRDSAGVLQRVGLQPDLVQERAQGGLVGARAWQRLRGVRIGRGVADMIPLATLYNTQRPQIPSD
jgi:hypothetical protein